VPNGGIFGWRWLSPHDLDGGLRGRGIRLAQLGRQIKRICPCFFWKGKRTVDWSDPRRDYVSNNARCALSVDTCSLGSPEIARRHGRWRWRWPLIARRSDLVTRLASIDQRDGEVGEQQKVWI